MSYPMLGKPTMPIFRLFDGRPSNAGASSTTPFRFDFFAHAVIEEEKHALDPRARGIRWTMVR